MGTRSLTYVYDDKTPVVCMYRQFDGYPTGHGAELANFLNGFEIVNGYSEVRPKLANGMGCLAAQMIVHFKDGTGGFYLVETVLGQDCSQDYEYHVYRDSITILDSDRSEIFSGSWEEFYNFCVEKEAA
jgi:hypothetical protein